MWKGLSIEGHTCEIVIFLNIKFTVHFIQSYVRNVSYPIVLLFFLPGLESEMVGEIGLSV